MLKTPTTVPIISFSETLTTFKLIAEGASNGGFLSDGVTLAPANFGVSDADRYVQYKGETVDRLALNSQVRFQNDLKIDNLIAKKSNDFDSDGIREVYWKIMNLLASSVLYKIKGLHNMTEIDFEMFASSI